MWFMSLPALHDQMWRGFSLIYTVLPRDFVEFRGMTDDWTPTLPLQPHLVQTTFWAEEVAKMTEQNIIHLFRQRRSYEAEYAIMRDCSDVLHDPDQAEQALNHAILKRKMALVDHWLAFLSQEERDVIEQHLIQNKPWTQIAAHIEQKSNGDIACDERTLQRQQAKAIARIHVFMQEQFADEFDFLVEKKCDD